jgi:hypothetical protein
MAGRTQFSISLRKSGKETTPHVVHFWKWGGGEKVEALIQDDSEGRKITGATMKSGCPWVLRARMAVWAHCRW